ncbi:MAG TPA: cbb3-type cytochrome c oxidase subunit 3 [Pseudobdellovibrionaceae bacterium]|nr:cbb3-type cytochrome c oxidase subunit 3 [Pseudobdellovibrionaceae bacterium]
MKQLLVTQFPMQWMTLVALLIFLTVFVGIALWTFRIVRREKWEQIAARAILEHEPLPLRPTSETCPEQESAR